MLKIELNAEHDEWGWFVDMENNYQETIISYSINDNNNNVKQYNRRFNPYLNKLEVIYEEYEYYSNLEENDKPPELDKPPENVKPPEKSIILYPENSFYICITTAIISYVLYWIA